ncbi:condensation domain-containing protein, partial [Kitasatospora sp. NPDC050463]|uniref:condensation domain-containing protein n=1 Tax=Kitasatospora sp. NPDC050463 TaxID=3155786 RepID=UPI0034014D59
MTHANERIANLTDTQRALLEKLLSAKRADRTIARADRSKPLPLSFAQQRLWFLDRMAPGTTSWNACSSVRVRGGLDVGALGGALSVVVGRHEVLRTVFR